MSGCLGDDQSSAKGDEKRHVEFHGSILSGSCSELSKRCEVFVKSVFAVCVPIDLGEPSIRFRVSFDFLR
jgi:hypothetical protein